MQYMLLIYENEADWQAMPEADRARLLEGYEQFHAGLAKNGQYVGSNRLAHSGSATTVRVRENRTITTDGPFAETKEQLGGYFLVEAEDLDAAVALAAEVPGARVGAIEVRPLWRSGMTDDG
ncbi:MAG: YciI family protein [Pseudomonadota bacterium]